MKPRSKFILKIYFFLNSKLIGRKLGFNTPLKAAWVQCFSMQVVINKCFFLNSEKKKLAQIRLVVFEKNAKNAHFNSEK